MDMASELRSVNIEPPVNPMTLVKMFCFCASLSNLSDVSLSVQIIYRDWSSPKNQLIGGMLFVGI